MKKLLTIAFIFICTLWACKNKSSENTQDATKQEQTQQVAPVKKDAYKCPMDCEKGKTYEVAGKCPVCKMDLALEGEKKENDGHAH